ncbi:hypothetical protein ACR9E3_32350 [Actinomycetospora sp. C-140]
MAVGELVDDEPEAALAHARFARHRASRVAIVREASGLAAYHAGEWAEALSELRASRRMGGDGHLPVMADAERALGRPERAIELSRSPEAADLATEDAVELLIVVSGARRDLGEDDAAVVGLQVPELDATREDPWVPRLFYAYAEALQAAGRTDDAVRAFLDAARTDVEGETDAEERAIMLGVGAPEADEDTDQDAEATDTDADTDEDADQDADEATDAGDVAEDSPSGVAGSSG